MSQWCHDQSNSASLVTELINKSQVELVIDDNKLIDPLEPCRSNDFLRSSGRFRTPWSFWLAVYEEGAGLNLTGIERTRGDRTQVWSGRLITDWSLIDHWFTLTEFWLLQFQYDNKHKQQQHDKITTWGEKCWESVRAVQTSSSSSSSSVSQ